MSRMWIVLLIALIFSVVVSHGVEYTNVAAVFQLGTGARPLGMAGAFLALVDDENAAFYNPAGLGWIDRIGVTSLFSKQLGGVSYGALSLSLPYFGLSLLQLDSGWIPAGEGGIRYVSQAGVVSSGFAIGPMGLGVRGKLYRVREPYTALGWALDPAILVITDVIRVGLLIENPFAPPIAFGDGHTEAWEGASRLGVAVTLRPSEGVRWNAVFEASGLFSSTPGLAVGLEAWVGGLAVRVGVADVGVTLGLTVQFANFYVDWAYATRLELGDSHRVSLTFKF
jgi:hypothetical protein